MKLKLNKPHEKIAISGHTGLIGSKASGLFRNNEVSFIPFSFRELSKNEVRDLVNAFVNQGCKTILLLSWPGSSTEDYRNSAQNYSCKNAIRLIIEEAVEKGLRVVATGTILEFSPIRSSYTDSKAELREEISEHIEAGRVTWARPHFVFEPHKWPTFVRSEAVEIENDAPRDFIAADDVADAFFRIISNGLVGEIEICSGTLRKPSELLESLGIQFRVQDSKMDLLPAPRLPNSDLISSGWMAMRTTAIFDPNA
jgi:nucleoside-diphosphate-sugar epimerase